ncbi:MAG: DUF3341 domain-containing protein [Pyrinomonadaceae bacterium]
MSELTLNRKLQQPSHAGELYGVMAEFETPDAVVDAARRAYAQGYRRMDAYSPFPIEELSEAVGFHKTSVPLIVLLGGIIGCITGYLMQYYLMAIDYPLQIGGKPFNSWPQYIPITFETTVLFAASAGVIGMLALNGLPMPYHPVFNVPRFELASSERFFLVIEATDPKFKRDEATSFLQSLNPHEVSDVQL